jgi:hypothetical protein
MKISKLYIKTTLDSCVQGRRNEWLEIYDQLGHNVNSVQI